MEQKKIQLVDGNKELITFVKFTMGTAFTTQIVVERRTSEKLYPELKKISQNLSYYLDQIDKKFSPFKANSELNQFRRGELDWLSLSEEMRYVIASCEQAKIVTEHAFDHYYSGVLDTTGFVKGWAIETAFQQYLAPLLGNPLIHAVNLIGGGDMQMKTRKDSNWTFTIGIVDPFDKKKAIYEVKMKSGAIATSGIMERGHHIENADNSLVQTTVIGESLQVVDVYATALMINPNLALPQKFQSIIIDREGERKHAQIS